MDDVSGVAVGRLHDVSGLWVASYKAAFRAPIDRPQVRLGVWFHAAEPSGTRNACARLSSEDLASIWDFAHTDRWHFTMNTLELLFIAAQRAPLSSCNAPWTPPTSPAH